MARLQLKLHAAMAAVLVDAATECGTAVWLTYGKSRDAEYDLYRRPVDGQHPPAGQVSARGRQYPALFEQRRADGEGTRLMLRAGPS